VSQKLIGQWNYLRQPYSVVGRHKSEADLAPVASALLDTVQDSGITDLETFRHET
jgi:hypothetical protein